MVNTQNFTTEEKDELIRELYGVTETFVKELSDGVLEELRYTWGETNYRIVKAKKEALIQALSKVRGD